MAKEPRHERVGGSGERDARVGGQPIRILPHEARAAVLDGPRVVAQHEFMIAGRAPAAPPTRAAPATPLGLGKECGPRVRLMRGESKRAVRRARQAALVVQQRQQADRGCLNQSQQLGVARHADVGPRDALGGVGARLGVEDAFEEVGVQRLVCEVDEELLEGVGVEALKPKDVEQTDRAPHPRGRV